MRCTFCGHEFGDAAECSDCGMPRASMSDDLSDFDDDLAFDDQDASPQTAGFASDEEPVDRTLQNLAVQDIVAALASVDSPIAAQVAAGHGLELPGQSKVTADDDGAPAVDDNSDLLDFDEEASSSDDASPADDQADAESSPAAEAPFSLDGETPGVRLRVGRPTTVPSLSLPEGDEAAPEEPAPGPLSDGSDDLPQDDFSPPQEVFYEDSEAAPPPPERDAPQPARGWGLVVLIAVLMAIVGGVVYMFLTAIRMDADAQERRQTPARERVVDDPQKAPAKGQGQKRSPQGGAAPR